MSATTSAPRRGRPPKFGRPAQLVTLTLPEDVVAWLATVDADLGWAVVKLHERSTKGRPTKPAQVADLVQLPGQRALILVQPEPFKNLAGVSVIPLADGRAFLALDAGRGVSDLEISVIDRLEATSLAPTEREALTHLRTLLRQWRQQGVNFESRSIIIAQRQRTFRDARPLASLGSKSRSSSGA